MTTEQARQQVLDLLRQSRYGSMTMADLVGVLRNLGWTNSHGRSTVQQLIDRGLVEKVSVDGDFRVKALRLSPVGWQAVDGVPPGRRRVVR